LHDKYHVDELQYIALVCAVNRKIFNRLSEKPEKVSVLKLNIAADLTR
jgi:hypothetical protein